MNRVLCVAFALGVTVTIAAQQPPQFRAGVELVTLDVTVLDRDRQPVTGLTAEDFILRENGQPQTIATFLPVHVPPASVPAAEWARTATVDVAINTLDDQRLLVLVMDDATLPMDLVMLRNAKDAARRFVEQLGPTDRAAVVFTRDNRYAQDFTQDKALLLAAIERTTTGFIAGGGNHELAIKKGAVGPEAGALSLDRSFYLASINTLARVSEHLAAIPLKKKAIAWVSLGIPLDTDQLAEVTLIEFMAPSHRMGNPMANSALFQALNRLLDRAQRANVAIYGISPSGVTGEDWARLRRIPGMPSELGGLERVRGLPPMQLFNEFLLTVAEQTGGRAFLETNDVRAGIDQMFDETGSYYLIGYVPAPRGRDGSYRRVEVTTTRKGLDVRARKGYYAGPPPALPDDDALRGLSSVAGLLPDARLPLRGVAVPFAQPDGASVVALTVALDARAVPAPAPEGVEIAIHAFDPEGRPQGTFTQRAPWRDVDGWHELTSVLPLPAGRYALRISAEPVGAPVAGSVYLSVTVPDFSQRGAWLTGLAVAVEPAASRLTDAALRALLPVVPTTRRVWTPTYQAAVIFRVHQGGTRTPVEVTQTIRITDEQDKRVLERVDTLAAARFEAARVVEQRLELPIADLPPGRYLLTVAVTASSTPAQQRELVFEITS